MLGIKPNRITGSDDTITSPTQTNPNFESVDLPHQSNATDEIELPSVEKEDIQEIPREPQIPGEEYEDMFGTIDKIGDFNPCPCKKPNKLFGKFDGQQYDEDDYNEPTVEKEQSKYPLVYVGMGLALLKYLF